MKLKLLLVGLLVTGLASGVSAQDLNVDSSDDGAEVFIEDVSPSSLDEGSSDVSWEHTQDTALAYETNISIRDPDGDTRDYITENNGDLDGQNNLDVDFDESGDWEAYIEYYDGTTDSETFTVEESFDEPEVDLISPDDDENFSSDTSELDLEANVTTNDADDIDYDIYLDDLSEGSGTSDGGEISEEVFVAGGEEYDWYVEYSWEEGDGGTEQTETKSFSVEREEPDISVVSPEEGDQLPPETTVTDLTAFLNLNDYDDTEVNWFFSEGNTDPEAYYGFQDENETGEVSIPTDLDGANWDGSDLEPDTEYTWSAELNNSESVVEDQTFEVTDHDIEVLEATEEVNEGENISATVEAFSTYDGAEASYEIEYPSDSGTITESGNFDINDTSSEYEFEENTSELVDPQAGDYDITFTVDSGGDTITDSFTTQVIPESNIAMGVNEEKFGNTKLADTEVFNEDAGVEDGQWDFNDEYTVIGEEFTTFVVVHTQDIEPEDVNLWFEMGGENVTAPVFVDDVNPSDMELSDDETGTEDDELTREGFVATMEQRENRNTFGIPEDTYSYNNDEVPDIQASRTEEIEEGTNATYFWVDFNNQTTESYVDTEGEIFATADGLEDSKKFNYSSEVDFRNFRSSSSVDSLDTTLSFDSDSSLVSDGKFVSPESNPVITIDKTFEPQEVLEIVDGSYSDDFDFVNGVEMRNTHTENITILNDRGQTEEVEPQEEFTLEATKESGEGSYTVEEVLTSFIETRQRFLTKDNISKELEIDGNELERGEFLITYNLEDDYENLRNVDRTFEIREDSYKGQFYQMFDNSFEWDDWQTGLLVLGIIVLGGFLIIDLKLSLMIAGAYALAGMVALLFSGFLPLQINLLIMVVLAGLVAYVLRKVIG